MKKQQEQQKQKNPLLYYVIILSFIVLVLLVTNYVSYNIIKESSELIIQYDELIGMQEYGLDYCQTTIETCGIMLYNYENYCPTVFEGLQNGSLKLLMYQG